MQMCASSGNLCHLQPTYLLLLAALPTSCACTGHIAGMSHPTPPTFCYLQPPPPTLPMYRSPCWCVTRGTHSDKSVVCIPPAYLIGVEKCGTQDVSQNVLRHPLVESADNKEQDYWMGAQPGNTSEVPICRVRFTWSF